MATRLVKMTLAELPSPVTDIEFKTAVGRRPLSIKRDDISNATYGGNKIRKLEYILQRAREREIGRAHV